MCLDIVGENKEIVENKLVTTQALSYTCENDYCHESISGETTCEESMSKSAWDIDVKCKETLLDDKS